MPIGLVAVNRGLKNTAFESKPMFPELTMRIYMHAIVAGMNRKIANDANTDSKREPVQTTAKTVIV